MVNVFKLSTDNKVLMGYLVVTESETVSQQALLMRETENDIFDIVAADSLLNSREIKDGIGRFTEFNMFNFYISITYKHFHEPTFQIVFI